METIIGIQVRVVFYSLKLFLLVSKFYAFALVVRRPVLKGM